MIVRVQYARERFSKPTTTMQLSCYVAVKKCFHTKICRVVNSGGTKAPADRVLQ